MAVYRPKYRDPKTGRNVKAAIWWCDFVIARKRVRESTKTSRKTIAVEYEKSRRRELERALAGLPAEDPTKCIKTVHEVIQQYVEGYKLNHRHQSWLSVKSALGRVAERLGTLRLPDLTEARIRQYIAERKKQGVANRTVNVGLNELSRAIGHTWKRLWPRLRKLEERQDIGRALPQEERQRLLGAADKSPSPNLKTLIRAAFLTGTRSSELTSLQWNQVDFAERIITIGTAKTRAGTGRAIPMNDELLAVMAAHAAWYTDWFGETRPEYHVFPFGSPVPNDPKRPTVEIKTAWNTVRRAAGVKCRWHDLRHTACSDMNEKGVPEATQLAIFGWSSRKMIERYSHIGNAAKREAMNSLTTRERPVSVGVPKDSPKETTLRRLM
jgi:integrase